MTVEISVVIPMRNEAPNVDDLFGELSAALHPCGRSYEIIVVDDGSTDDTYERLARAHARDPRITVIRFRRNFGQTAAFAAGFARARGRYIVTLDGDLQNDPRDIPAMVEKLEARGVDIVAGWRRQRKDPLFSRRLPSMAANWIISQATGVKLHDYGCSLKVFRADVVKTMRLYGEMHRFLPAIASEMGVSVDEHIVNHRARSRGRSNYGISRTIRVVLDLMTVKFLISHSTRPMQMFGLVGLIMGFMGTLVCAYIAYMKYFGEWAGDRTWLLLLGILLIFTGVQLVTLGLLAEMQSRTYHESQNKPIYVIRDVLEGDVREHAGDAEPRVSIKRFI